MTLAVVVPRSTSRSDSRAAVFFAPDWKHLRDIRRERAISSSPIYIIVDTGAFVSGEVPNLLGTTPAPDVEGETLITLFNTHRPLTRSTALRTLAREALAANRQPEDIDAWARQLADDVADATD